LGFDLFAMNRAYNNRVGPQPRPFALRYKPWPTGRAGSAVEDLLDKFLGSLKLA
jgi:hypothetical protein